MTLQPNWSEVYRGERITLRCEIKDGGDTEWEYEWRTTSSEKPPDQNKHSITSVTRSHSGDYRCKGRKKHTQHSSTGWSDPIKLTVSDGKSHHISFKVKIIQLINRLFLFMYIFKVNLQYVLMVQNVSDPLSIHVFIYKIIFQQNSFLSSLCLHHG